jgi:Protein of unknown function (DUF1566)
MNAQGYLQTGQHTCHDTLGHEIACAGSGQDGEWRRGIPWPVPRFEEKGQAVLDRLTGLTWMENANRAELPMSWQEALDYVAATNQERALGYADWRLPNRRELRSLMSHQTRKPALPEGYPFRNVYPGWYWTSTTAAINTAYAWYVHTEGARMFYGQKEQFFLVWPVRGVGFGVLPTTGLNQCYDAGGHLIPCEGSGQDGELRMGRAWPELRFKAIGDTVIDHLTNLCWFMSADLAGRRVTWSDAFAAIEGLKEDSEEREWRLPNINELESLVDCRAHHPALPSGHLFTGVREGYWSSTTSLFEPDWAWALYLTKGAIGVGQKKGAHFHVWAVRDASDADIAQ